MIPNVPRPTSVEDLPNWERYGPELLSIDMSATVINADPATVGLIAGAADVLGKEHGLVVIKNGTYWSVRMPTPPGGALEALRRAQRSWDEAHPIIPRYIRDDVEEDAPDEQDNDEEGDH